MPARSNRNEWLRSHVSSGNLNQTSNQKGTPESQSARKHISARTRTNANSSERQSIKCSHCDTDRLVEDRRWRYRWWLINQYRDAAISLVTFSLAAVAIFWGISWQRWLLTSPTLLPLASAIIDRWPQCELISQWRQWSANPPTEHALVCRTTAPLSDNHHS